MNNTLKELLVMFLGYNNVCSIDNPRNKCVCFVKNESYYDRIKKIREDVWLIAPKDIPDELTGDNIQVRKTKHPEYEFTLVNNHINKYKCDFPNMIGVNYSMDKTSIIGKEGLKMVNCPDGSKIHFVHSGHVVIGDGVRIGAYSIIHKGTIDCTIIDDNVIIGDFVNIGHNCEIGKGTVIANGSIVSGSVKMGKNCWVGVGSLIRNGISICDDVVIGMGSNVLKSITKPGIYFGNPLKYQGKRTEAWNF